MLKPAASASDFHIDADGKTLFAGRLEFGGIFR
jgi:hypothetical protein